MSEKITNERVILSALLQNQDYNRKVLAYLKKEYFHDPSEEAVLSHIQKFSMKYDTIPNMADLIISLKNDEQLSEKVTETAIDVTNDVFDITPSKNIEYLVKMTEDFCADKAMYNAIQESILIYRGESKSTTHSIPSLLQDAMAVSFDAKIGQEYLADAESRWEWYNNPESRIPFDIDALNDRTNGGIPRKTLNVLSAGTNVGKSMCLVSLAAMYMRQGLNVVYFSNEMSEESVLNRVDANIFNVAINDIGKLDSKIFHGKIKELRQKNYGKLYVKEYPTGQGNAALYRNYLNELKLKKKVSPDVIIVDYLTITGSASMRGNEKSYEKYRIVAEELRALMVEFNAVGWSAAQFNRSGAGDTDPDMTDIGESFGIPQTTDSMWAIVRTEELDEIGQLLFIELKSRYGTKGKPRFTVGVSIETQSLFNVPQTTNFTREASEPKKKFTDKTDKSIEKKFTNFNFEDDE